LYLNSFSHGSLEHYKDLIIQATDDAISHGFILPEDRDTYIVNLVVTANQRLAKKSIKNNNREY
jgi:hypothetical protein